MSSPICFSPDLSAPLDSAQGQSMVPVLWGVEVDGQPPNAPDSPCCAVKILMDPGKTGRVSNPHVHDEVHVYVTLDPGSPPVCTLSGERLENVAWTRGGETLWIPPGVPHVAICPVPDSPAVAVGTEFRTTPSYRHDVRPLPELWDQVRIGIELNRLKVRPEALPELARPAGGCWPSEIPYKTA